MKLVTRVETYDGKLHEDACAARHYLSEQEGAQISALARLIIIGEGKYARAVELLESPETEKHLRALLRIRDDLTLVREEEI